MGMIRLLAAADFPIATVLGLTILGIVLVWVTILQANKRDALLERLTRKLGGKFIAGSLMTGPSIEFTLGGCKATLEVFEGGRNSPRYSRVIVDLRGRSPGSLHILPEGFGQSFLKLFGAQDLEIGDDSFDAAYVVRAEPASLAGRVFSRDRRDEVIQSVRRIAAFNNPTIDADRNGLTVQVRELLTEEISLMNLVKTVEDFIGYLVEPAAPSGIQWGDVRMSEGGQCPVCGTELKETIGRCASCKTPHHRECWEYMGRCSTYACKGTRFVA